MFSRLRHYPAFFQPKRLWWVLGLSALLLVGFRGADKYFDISRNMDIFGKVFTEVNEVYVDDTNPTNMMQTGINAMLESLDPYTNFFPESMIEQSMVLNSGQLSGIGAEIGSRGDLALVLELYQGGPADQAGIRVGDQLIQIDDELVGPKGRTVEEAKNLLQGESGTEITVHILRAGDPTPRIITMTRGGNETQQENVPFSDIVTDNIGYILLNNFMGSAGNEVASALKNLKKDHPELKGVVLDLRGNPGGRLDEAVNVCNVFLPQGTYITAMKGRTSSSNQRFSTNMPALDTEIPVVVLIDESSASASEIVSGALQDMDRGVILGRRSYGKGLVQNVRPLSYNTQMKITIARYYIPSGRCIQSLDYAHRNADGTPGIAPDSARQAFETKNGRIVYDGGGILPDVVVEGEKDLPIVRALKEQGVLFDFVTKFAAENDSIAQPRDFQVSPAVYSDFVTFVRQRGFEFRTSSEGDLEKLEKAMATDGFDKSLQNELQALRNNLESQKVKDLERHQKRLTEVLRQAIVSRYYYKQGLLESGFMFDPDIQEAVSVIQDQARYQALLGK